MCLTHTVLGLAITDLGLTVKFLGSNLASTGRTQTKISANKLGLRRALGLIQNAIYIKNLRINSKILEV